MFYELILAKWPLLSYSPRIVMYSRHCIIHCMNETVCADENDE